MKKQIFRTADQKEFVGLFEGLCMRRHAWQAWGDFVEASAIAVSNSCDKVSPDRGKREERYRQIMAGYEPLVIGSPVCCSGHRPDGGAHVLSATVPAWMRWLCRDCG